MNLWITDEIMYQVNAVLSSFIIFFNNVENEMGLIISNFLLQFATLTIDITNKGRMDRIISNLNILKTRKSWVFFLFYLRYIQDRDFLVNIIVINLISLFRFYFLSQDSQIDNLDLRLHELLSNILLS